MHLAVIRLKNMMSDKIDKGGDDVIVWSYINPNKKDGI